MKCVMYLLCLCLVALNIEANPSVDIFRPCHYSDSKCLKESANLALPKFCKGIDGVPSFDPLILNDVNGDTGELKLRFKKIEVRELCKCEIVEITRDNPLTLSIELHCPIRASGDYYALGPLGVTKVDGQDKFEFQSEKIIFKVQIKLKPFQKDGLDYYKIASFDYSYDPVEKVFIKFLGLEKRDKTLASVVAEYLDTDWKNVMLTTAQPVCKEMITQCTLEIGKWLSTIPKDQLEIV